MPPPLGLAEGGIFTHVPKKHKVYPILIKSNQIDVLMCNKRIFKSPSQANFV